jgi:hypothetical protein
MMVRVTRWFVLAAAVLGLAVGSVRQAEAGQVLYASLDNGTIERFDPATGKDLGPFASGLNLPSGLAFDASGNLYAANSGNNTISEITPGGQVSTFASGLNDPRGLAFNASGNLFVANNGNDTISKITPGGQVSTFASDVDFARPVGLAFDASGNLFAASFRNYLTIDEITPDGTVSTFASGLSSSPRFLAIRDESPATVPEPATLVQAVSGVALLGLVAWVRRLRGARLTSDRAAKTRTRRSTAASGTWCSTRWGWSWRRWSTPRTSRTGAGLSSS